jgi:hypothetical protein
MSARIQLLGKSFTEQVLASPSLHQYFDDKAEMHQVTASSLTYIRAGTEDEQTAIPNLTYSSVSPRKIEAQQAKNQSSTPSFSTEAVNPRQQLIVNYHRVSLPLFSQQTSRQYPIIVDQPVSHMRKTTRTYEFHSVHPYMRRTTGEHIAFEPTAGLAYYTRPPLYAR